MAELLPERLPWFVAGPLIGLLVVGLYAVANRPLGVSGAYVQVLGLVRSQVTERWRVWYFVGLLAGALLFALLRGGPSLSLGYGGISLLLPLALLAPLLFVAGVLMGYGAAWAGGCTSGHGLCGSSMLSPGSLVATATFMLTAVILTLAFNLLSGGRL